MTETAVTGVDMTAAALALYDIGACVIPAAIDGTKAPLGKWRRYQSERMAREEVAGWFDGAHPGMGIVCGKVSGGLEMLEFEGRAVDEGAVATVTDLAQAAGLSGIWARLLTGYCERTPSGGIHLLYRVDDAPAAPNTKLARRPATTAELATNPNDKTKVLIETRGEGGFVVVAPSHDTTHETGRPWEQLAGGPASIPTLTAAERDAIHSLCKTLDQTPRVETPPFTQPALDPGGDGGTSPGDDYETRTDWGQILGPHGWTLVFQRGKIRYWRRPGKNRGISATTGAADDRDRLYVFTTSTPFEPETPYTKFGAVALLDHGGDHSAAAKALHSAGYGRPAPEQPRPAFTQPAGNSDAANSSVPATVVGGPVTYSLTDDGNALRLVDAHSAIVRYCPQRALWLSWNGHRWAWDHAEQVREHARAIARALPEPDKEQRRHRRRSLSASAIGAMVRLAQSDPRIVAETGDLDQDAYALNSPAGVVDLRTGTLRPADPAALHTRSTTVAPDPTTTPARWLRFLATTFPEDPALVTYLQRLLGVSLAGTVLEQVLPFGFGDGANGKTTLLGVIMRLVGIGDEGYALSAPSELLLATHNTGHPTEVARLSGARLVVTSELDEGQQFAEARIKQLTGRDPIAARFMHGDFFTFTPSHTLWILGNHQPAVRAGGPAFWRRLRLLPFLHTVPPENRDPYLEDRLVNEEGPAILAWLIQGAADYFSGGLAEPESVRAATGEYEGSQDTISRFVEEECHTGNPTLQTMAVRVSALRQAYETWCRVEGEEPRSARALTLALRSRFGVISERSSTARYYRGIRLNDPTPDNEETTSW